MGLKSIYYCEWKLMADCRQQTTEKTSAICHAAAQRFGQTIIWRFSKPVKQKIFDGNHPDCKHYHFSSDFLEKMVNNNGVWQSASQ
jgi:hypothetical protein